MPSLAGSSIRQSFSTMSHKSEKGKRQRRNVVLMILVALVLLAALAVIIGISVFFTHKKRKLTLII